MPMQQKLSQYFVVRRKTLSYQEVVPTTKKRSNNFALYGSKVAANTGNFLNILYFGAKISLRKTADLFRIAQWLVAHHVMCGIGIKQAVFLCEGLNPKPFIVK